MSTDELVDQLRQQQLADALGHALHRAGLTSYPYATAEIHRVLTELRSRGYDICKK